MADNSQVEEIHNNLTSICPQIRLNRNDAGNLLFDIPSTSRDSISSLVTYLENQSPQVGQEEASVREFGISHSTLEEVFLEVTRRNNFAYEDEEEEKVIEDDSMELLSKESELNLNSNLVDQRNSKPLKALLRKNFILQKRQMGTNVCQILTPMLVMIVLLVLQRVSQAQTAGLVSTFLRPTVPYVVNSPEMYDLKSTPVVSCWITGDSARSLDNFDTYTIRLENQTDMKSPNVQYKLNANQMEGELYDLQSQLNQIDKKYFTQYPLNSAVPDVLYDFHRVQTVGQSLVVDYTFSINDLPVDLYHTINGFTDYSRWMSVYPDFLFIEAKVAAMLLISDNINSSDDEEKRSKVNLQSEVIHQDEIVDNSYFRNMAETAEMRDFPINFKVISYLQTKRAVQMMPYNMGFDILALVELAGAVLYPIALSLQLPIYIYLLVMEKGATKEFIKSHGIKTSYYIFSHFLFNFILFTIVVTSFWLWGVGIELRIFTQTHPVLLIVLFLGWANSMIAMAFFLSTFIDTTRSATVVGYVVALIGSLIGILFCAGIYGNDIPFTPNLSFPTAYLILPQFAFIRAIYLMSYRCNSQTLCYGMFHSFSDIFNTELGRCLLFLFVDAIIYMVVAIYLEAVLPRDYGVPKHPLFFLGFGRNKLVDGESAESLQGRNDEEEDVKWERERVINLPQEELKDQPLVVNNLRKVFPPSSRGKPPKVAVKGLYLCVQRGECFGLLGENGAGKTTSISILTGLITPSSGTAFVVGHDIRTNIDQVHLNIGICPQFSVLWPDLTVEEHLYFFARLKGIKASEEKSHVEECLKRYGLINQRDKRSKNLSGGMQRRLSVAMALVGNSQIVFLDEPTTGLDPASRRQLWRIISLAKEGRAIILTTHSMEEAELLCSRIGILAKGEMKCLGGPLRLKSKFASGYCIKVNYEPYYQEQVEEGIRNLFGDSVIETGSFSGTSEYRVNGFKLSQLFEKMERESASMNVKAWSLSQAGLEDVFEAIVEGSHKKSEKKFPSLIAKSSVPPQKLREMANHPSKITNKPAKKEELLSFKCKSEKGNRLVETTGFSFDLLKKSVESKFGETDFKIQFKDADGDLIFIDSDSDLKVAVETYHVKVLYLVLNLKEELVSLQE
eukprot:TRINITY_DN2658_c0_g1_i1.p1 TRINITY_DN2658_c0_g1~~TRINITY_DN2658_c0_g1_i1.p1  ORF type:complete len:1127 (+),score=257.54 TRINITY_DN2658_c0_g1_i1:1736-5116(+)